MFRSAARSLTSSILISSRPMTYKTSTGLAGLAVDPNGRETLRNLSVQVLESVKVIFLPKIYYYIIYFNFIFIFNRKFLLKPVTVSMLRSGTLTSTRLPLRRLR